MKVLIAAAALTCVLAAPAFAQSGNITGTETRGEPLNNSVHSPAINPQTGKMPGYGYRSGTRAHAKYYVKKKPHHTRSHVTTGSSGY
jgi:hypothetical protein